MSMRIYLEVLSSFDFIIAASTRDSECVRVSVRLKGRCQNPNRSRNRDRFREQSAAQRSRKAKGFAEHGSVEQSGAERKPLKLALIVE